MKYLIFFFTLGIPFYVQAQCNGDRDALMALYNATDGDNWTRNTNWGSDGSLGNWWGITTNSQGCVTEINLVGNNLGGRLPQEIGNLSQLITLAINDSPDLEGGLPSTIGNLFNLENLIIHRTRMSFSIPSTIGNLSKLKILRLHANEFRGDIPSSLYSLTQLEELNLGSNELGGTIDSRIGNLRNLKDLGLSYNFFRGDLPKEFWQMTQLEELFLDQNTFTGGIHEDIGNLTQLRRLGLSTNDFSGVIPVTMINLRNLQEFYYFSTQLCYREDDTAFTNWLNRLRTHSGSGISCEDVCSYRDRRALMTLYDALGGNNWTDNTNWGSDEPLGDWYGVRALNDECVLSLDLGRNNLSGTIPNEIQDLPELTQIFMINNKLAGDIPKGLGSLKKLRILALSENQFTGGIPRELGNAAELVNVYLDDNQLDGAIPSELRKLQKLSRLWLNENLFTFEDFLPSVNLFNLNFDYIYHNQSSVGKEQTITLNAGETYTVDLGIDENVTTNVYKWVKDGVELPEVNTNQFTINEPGIYTGWVINPAVPDLSLQIKRITVEAGIDANCLNHRDVLMEFYNATNGASWKNRTNWGSNQPLKEWYGLYTDEFGCVTHFNLRDNNLEGSIPTSIGSLQTLTELFLDRNQLTGEIPSSIANMKALLYLSLWRNKLTGEIPSALGELTELLALSVNDNQLTGEISNSIGQLQKLQYLDLDRNQLSGSIPSSFNNLQNLIALDLKENQLTGTVPFNKDIPTLKELYLSDNQLSGTFPNFSNLEKLWIFNNQFTFEEIIGNNPSQQYYYYAQAKIGKEETITLNAGENYTIDLGIDESITSNVYQWFKDGQIFQQTSVNQLTVTEPGVFTAKVTNPNAPDLTLESYAVTIEPGVDCTGNRDVLMAIYNATNGSNWTNNANWGSNAPLGDWYGVSTDAFGCVSGINLTQNQLEGSIPAEIGSLSQLTSLAIGYNQLSGELPSSVGDLSELRFIDTYTNQLTGAIPPAIGNLSNLESLRLGANELSGEIPREIGKLTKLRSLDLSVNELSGEIPIAITELVNLERIKLNINKLSGGVPSTIGNLVKLTSLDLRENLLSEPLPRQLGDLVNLEGLGLDENQLTGSLPREIGNLSKLTYLALDNNQLSGSLPPEIANLKELTQLLLNNNNFTGTIPFQIQNLNKLTFLYLNDNNFEGAIPNGIANLTQLKRLYLHNNSFISLPDISTITTWEDSFWGGVRVSYNAFSFDDIVPNISVANISNFQYNPQAKIGKEENIILEAGETYTIDLGIDENVASNVYQWFKNGEAFQQTNQNQITIAEAGVYTVKVTNPNAPELTLESYPVTIELNLNADFTLAPNPVEAGKSVQFTDASSGDITVWNWTFEGGEPPSSTEQNPAVQYDQTGTFQVALEVTDVSGNTESKTVGNAVEVVCPENLIFIQIQGYELTSTLEGERYEWRVNGNLLNDQVNNQSIIAMEAGSYVLTVTDEFGCTHTSAPTQITVTNLEDNFLDTKAFEVFPNPTDNEVSIELNQSFGDYSLTMYDMLGKVVWKTTTSEEILNINMSHLNTGIYFIELKSAQGTVRKKLIKQ